MVIISGLRGLRGFFFWLLAAASVAALATQNAPMLHLPPLDRALPPRAEAIYQAIAPRVETGVAMETVAFMAPLWRLAGNPAYDQSIDVIAGHLARHGVAYRVDTYTN